MTIDTDLRAAPTACLDGAAGSVPQDDEEQGRRWAVRPRTLSGVDRVDLATTATGIALAGVARVADCHSGRVRLRGATG